MNFHYVGSDFGNFPDKGVFCSSAYASVLSYCYTINVCLFKRNRKSRAKNGRDPDRPDPRDLPALIR